MAKPLTKQDLNGTLYVRPAAIEAAIEEALRQDLATLKRRAVITKKSTPEFLPLECLVYLIRQAGRENDEYRMSTLMPLLLSRCESLLGRIPKNFVPDVENLREEILAEFAVLFATDLSENTGVLDYFECKFYHAFKTFRLRFIVRERKRTESLIYASGQSNEEETDDEALSKAAARHFQSVGSVDVETKMSLFRALDRLPPELAKPVILRFVHGIQVESTDPDEITVAGLCGVSDRTIRTRIAKALDMLSEQLQEQNGRETHEVKHA